MNYSNWTVTNEDVMNAIITLTGYCQQYYNPGNCNKDCALYGECKFPPILLKMPKKLKENL